MPNHVFNTVTFNGTWEELILLKTVLAEPAPIQLASIDKDYFNFNFHSVITVDELIWNEYNGPQPEYKNITERLSHPSNHWYDWNVRVWGTKWNAYEVTCNDNLDENNLANYTLSYSFSTAWSPPIGIINAMPKFLSSLNSKATFVWNYEEEQGWGGIYEGNNDELIQTESWDIPNSHADYVNHDNKYGCVCQWEDDQERWFSDCPQKTVGEKNNG